MVAPTILSLLLSSGLASAAAVSRGANRPRDNTTPLGPDQALYFYNGTVEVRNKTDIPVYDPTASIPAPTNGSVHYNTSSSAPLSKRGSETVILPNADLDFLGWDVPMSRVVYASTADVTVTSTEGYSISDSLTVSQNADFTLVKDFLSVSMGISYSQTWQSTYSAATTFTVPKGKYGVVVTNAWTHRKSGNVWKGTIGSDGSVDYYQADSFTSKSYENLAWVDGVITVCVGDTYPLPRCLGEGTMT